jgi:redox-sensing transcriptional repressor
MDAESLKTAPLPSVRRLPAYLRFLQTLKARDRVVVSCTHIADELGLVSTQVRKDLAVTGIVGKPKVGYNVPALIDAIEEFLGWKNTSDAFVVGAGCLGSALMGYEGFKDYGLNLVAGFDVDPVKIGTPVHGKEIFPLEKLHDLALRMHVLIGVLTVWNYTPVQLEVPPSVIVEDVKLSASLAVLSSRLAEILRTPNAAQRQAAIPERKEKETWIRN